MMRIVVMGFEALVALRARPLTKRLGIVTPEVLWAVNRRVYYRLGTPNRVHSE